MATETRTWQIVDGKLAPVDTSLSAQGRTESFDLEDWLESDPSIVRPGLRLIGRQVPTRSGPLDLLGIDRSGDLVIIELKRDRLPREALVQAVDYASDIATWTADKVSEVCHKYTNNALDDVLSEAFPEVDLETININENQRIILIGFAIESALERMVEWLSSNYGVGINAILLSYAKTREGSEILTRTVVISEEIEEERLQKKKFSIAMSDEPGSYEEEELRELLTKYLSQKLITVERIREALIPACLEQERVTREELKEELVRRNLVEDLSTAWTALTSISTQLGLKKNDFLRQVIAYEYPKHHWEKDNYSIRRQYAEFVQDILHELAGKKVGAEEA